MKKILILLLILSLSLFAACKKTPTSSGTAGKTPAEIRGIIGVAKIIAHPALDAVERGLQDELAAEGFTNLEYDVQSANGELSTAASIANKFASEKVLVAVGIATPIAVSLANTFKDTPVVFSAVTDPADAGLVRPNVTGVSDATPVKAQIELALRLKPIKTLGHIYNAGEANSVVNLHILESVCEEVGITVVATTVNNTSEVKQATEALAAKKVDAIYVSTDNVVAAAITSVTSSANRNNIPVIGADPVTSAETGALAAYGVDYYKAGRETGKIIAQILLGAKPSEIPVKYMTQPGELQLYVDRGVAEKMGIQLSDNISELVEK